MAHAKPIVIDAAPLSTEETAEMLGVSPRDVWRVRELVEAVLAKHATPTKRRKVVAPPRRDTHKPARGSDSRI